MSTASVTRHNLIALARARFYRWWQNRLPLTDTFTPTRRNTYVLPTCTGLLLSLTLPLLAAATGCQPDLCCLLGLLLLVGCISLGQRMCHATLSGLSLHLAIPEPQFAGGSTKLNITLVNSNRAARHIIGLSVRNEADQVWSSAQALEHHTMQVTFTPARRGLHRVPALMAEMRFPLGIFRAWMLWRPVAQVLVYPAPEPFPPPLPPGRSRIGAGAAYGQNGGKPDAVRPRRRSIPLLRLVGSSQARADRDARLMRHDELWLDFAQAGGQGVEPSLTRLVAWVLQADRLGLDYGLRLPGKEIEPSSGEAHKQRCLEALALCRPHRPAPVQPLEHNRHTAEQFKKRKTLSF